MVGETEGPRKGIARAAIVVMCAALVALFVIASLPAGADSAQAASTGSAAIASIETGQ